MKYHTKLFFKLFAVKIAMICKLWLEIYCFIQLNTAASICWVFHDLEGFHLIHLLRYVFVAIVCLMLCDLRTMISVNSHYEYSYIYSIIFRWFDIYALGLYDRRCMNEKENVLWEFSAANYENSFLLRSTCDSHIFWGFIAYLSIYRSKEL